MNRICGPQVRVVAGAAFVLLSCTLAAAFNDPVVLEGPLTLQIRGPELVTATDAPLPVEVTLINGGMEPLLGSIRLGVIGLWRCEPTGEIPFDLSAGAETQVLFHVTAGIGTFNALYPIHAWAKFRARLENREAHAVLILKTEFDDIPEPARSVPWTPFSLANNSRMTLWNAPVHRAVIQTFDESAAIVQPVAWEGAEEQTRGSVAMDQRVNRGETREAIAMHPAWFQGRAGTTLLEFPIRLPDVSPIRLSFSNATRDTDAARGEPPSDGVTFRVRALPLDAPEGRFGEVLWERHSSAKSWEDAEVDISALAGMSIRLQLECHPGPHNDTTCDSAYWGRPALAAGDPDAATEEVDTERPVCELGTMRHHGDSYSISVQPGKRGLLDGIFAFAGVNNRIEFEGLHVCVFHDLLHTPHSFHRLTRISRKPAAEGRDRWAHSFEGPYGSFTLVIELWTEDGAFCMRAYLEDAPDPQPWRVAWLEDIAVGPWSETAPRIYAGVGNVLVEPEAFELGFDGHQLATSFVGFEFANGLSMVQAVDTPPQRLDVNPNDRIYTLRAEHATTMYFIPSSDVWKGVRTWRRVNGLCAAAGVEKLAGRFVFDLWGGRYGQSREALQRSFRYGLTDSVVVWHNWQRWGYDYRLPDILPPNPDLGTEEEFRQLVQSCKEQDVLFAPHDNYIDLYPDADGFSYDRVAFTPDRRPVPGWLNTGRDAQAYRWRVDAIRPFLEANVERIRKDFSPTAYFIDVWSSIRPHDYWSDTGAFYDAVYTRDTWRQFFALIRQRLGDNAPQISESGHDQLIGYLDGAQTNHLRVDADPQGPESWFVWRVRCKDSERIPWFDMAHHDRFVLHGAGYDARYRAGLDTAMHGIYSDDYTVTEVLTGHPAMVPVAFGRDVVRKYWLSHGIMRALAGRPIEWTGFMDDDIHRQYVRWSGGGQVWVNRGGSEWEGEKRLLPQYGFYASVPFEGEEYKAGIERRDGVLVEWSSGPDQIYANARPFSAQGTAIDRRMNVENKMINFGPLATNGACRMHPDSGLLVVTPLPESGAFSVRLTWQELPWRLAIPTTGEAIDESGRIIAGISLAGDDEVAFEVPAGVFSVRLIP